MKKIITTLMLLSSASVASDFNHADRLDLLRQMALGNLEIDPSMLEGLTQAELDDLAGCRPDARTRTAPQHTRPAASTTTQPTVAANGGVTESEMQYFMNELSIGRNLTTDQLGRLSEAQQIELLEFKSVLLASQDEVGGNPFSSNSSSFSVPHSSSYAHPAANRGGDGMETILYNPHQEEQHRLLEENRSLRAQQDREYAESLRVDQENEATEKTRRAYETAHGEVLRVERELAPLKARLDAERTRAFGTLPTDIKNLETRVKTAKSWAHTTGDKEAPHPLEAQLNTKRADLARIEAPFNTQHAREIARVKTLEDKLVELRNKAGGLERTYYFLKRQDEKGKK